MKTVVVGADGQLGSEIVEQMQCSGFQIVPLIWEQMEVSDLEAVFSKMEEIAPDIIINTAAMHQVEECEQNPEQAFRVNGLGARNLALAARETGAVLVHISTDYVFDGSKGKPYEETDCPSPLNVYANTKVAGEYFIQSLTDRYYILRVCGLFGKHPCLAKRGGLNFVDLMLKLAREKGMVRVVDDEILTPTSTLEVARQIVALMRARPESGIYHASAEGWCSWFDFAKEIFDLTGMNVNLVKAQPGDFPAKVPRPKYSVLENVHLKKMGLNVMKPWQEGLKEYLQAKGCM